MNKRIVVITVTFIALLAASFYFVYYSSSNKQDNIGESDNFEIEGTLISIENMSFSKKQIRIQPGDTITWKNNDSVLHNVTSIEGPESFSSGNLNKGESFSYKFTQAGDYTYYCSIHTSMKASLTVGAEIVPLN